MKRKISLLLLAVLALTTHPIAPEPANGMEIWRQIQRRTQPAPMIQSPDGETWDESRDVYAKSSDEARRQCEQIAKNSSKNGAIVECLGCEKMTKGERRAARYSCTLRVEAARK